MEEKGILWAIGKLKDCCHRDSPGDTDTTSTNSAPKPATEAVPGNGSVAACSKSHTIPPCAYLYL